MEKEIVNTEDSTVKTTKARKTAAKVARVKTIEDLKPTDRVEVRNIRAWEISFVPMNGNIEQVTKGILIKGNSKMMFKLSEIEDQVNNGNELFCGIDGLGSHASIQIVDPLVREKVFGQPTDPVLLTADAVNEVLAIENKSEFNKALSNLVVTNSDKRMIIVMCTDKEQYPNVNTDDTPSYKLVAIEKISGSKLN